MLITDLHHLVILRRLHRPHRLWNLLLAVGLPKTGFQVEVQINVAGYSKISG
jgi:hypothetical protein